MSITRRLFLRNTAAAGAAASVSTAVPDLAVAETHPASSPAEQVKWHLSQARRLMEEVTGFHYDLTLEEELGFALLIQRDKPSQWRAVPSADGSSETVPCTHPAARAGGAA